MRKWLAVGAVLVLLVAGTYAALFPGRWIPWALAFLDEYGAAFEGLDAILGIGSKGITIVGWLVGIVLGIRHLRKRDINIGTTIIGDYVKEKIVHEAPAPEATVPHQPPAPPADFTGREEELAKLIAAVKEGGATISGLRGMGGVGKTALALVLARRLTPRYPDGQIYLDLRGTSPEPLSVTEAMAHVIRSYHPEAKLPETEAELSGFYHTLLHDKRALILMDNAASAEQVEPLIPPEGCLLLVTSRQRFTLPGLHSLDLDVLPPDDARALLLGIAPRIGDLADELAELCGYLPLALRVAASAVKTYVNLTPADYLRRLRDARGKWLEFVDASIGLSYELLTDQLKGRWSALAVFPGTFISAAAAAVWEIQPGEAQDALSALVARSLLEWNEGTGRYRLHDLARDCADARLGDDERAAAGARHAAHYLAAARAAGRLYLEGGEDVTRGLALFDLEWANIRAGQAWAQEHAEEDDAAAALCRDYPSGAAHCLDLRLHPRERVAWLDAALAAARRLGDRRAEGAHLGNLGSAYAQLGETRRAIEYYEQQLSSVREIGDGRGEANALGNLGVAYKNLGEICRAIKCYEQALAIDREIEDRRGEGADLGNLGLAYAALGETRRGVEFHQQALAIDREMGDRRAEGQDLGNLGLAYAELGETRRAIEFYEQSLAIAREIGDRRGEGNALGNLGNAYAALGETRRAIEYHQQALAIAREIGDRRAEGQDLGNLGNAYAALGETRRAIEYHQQALAIFREIGDSAGEGNALGNLGSAYLRLGDIRRAIEYYDEGLAIAHEIADRRGEANSLGNLGSAYALLGETRRAIEYYEQGLAIDREIGDRRGEGTDLWNLSLVLDQLGQRAQAIAHAQEALAIFEEIEDPNAEVVRRRLREWRGQ